MVANKEAKAVKTIRRVLETNRGAAMQLPHPEEKWSSKEVGLSDSEIHQFSQKGVMEKSGDVIGNTNANLWQTTTLAYEVVQDLSRKSETPCGHSGVRNLGGGEYTCTEESCDNIFDRETAEEVLNGNGA